MRKKQLSIGVANRLHEQLSYGYDAAGNLIGRTNNGFGQVFTVTNSFNQLNRVTRSGTFTAAGLVQSATNVTVTVKVNAEANILSVSGPLAEVNLYRFSSKEAHPISGLVYYGFRFYDPNLQRWLNRDPTHEEGGINLYEFALNSPMFWIDRDGRDIWLIELPGFFKHQVIIGDNPDGGYWFTDFGPRGGAAVTGPGVYGWTPQYSPEMLEKGAV